MSHISFAPLDFKIVGEMEIARARRKGAYIHGYDGRITVCGWVFGGVFYVDHIHKANEIEYPKNQAATQWIPCSPCFECSEEVSGILLGEKYQRVCRRCGRHGPERASANEADAAWDQETSGY